MQLVCLLIVLNSQFVGFVRCCHRKNPDIFSDIRIFRFNHLAVIDIIGRGKPLPHKFSRGEGVVQTASP